jgi:hypothetical protein
MRGTVHLHSFLQGQMFQGLSAGQTALPSFGRHLVHLMQLLNKPLLVARQEPLEAGIAAQHPLLVLNLDAAMVVEPGTQVARRRIGIRGRRISRIDGSRRIGA